MASHRLAGIPGFSIDRVAAAAGDDASVLRLENLDTDLAPPPAAVTATREAIGTDDANSYLPFVGNVDLREAVATRINRDASTDFTAANVVITCGATEGLLDALLALTNPGDEVVLTDPTYAGMIYRARLAGCTTRLVPFVEDTSAESDGPSGPAWRLDLDALRAAVTPRTRVLFLMNPSMPSGAVLNADEWQAVSEVCRAHDVWLLYNAAFERIVFDGRSVTQPAGLPGLAERTITVGSVSKEYRMIGWRVGWVAGPHPVIDDIARVHIYNAVTPTGIAQPGALAALGESEADFRRCLAEWQRRRDTVTDQLTGYAMIRAAGGWSQLLDVRRLGLGSFEASERLLAERVAATPMRDWGEANGDRFVRLVFSNESVERLATLRERVEAALGAP